jgi:two-component system sensor histidine kinase/response regulator
MPDKIKILYLDDEQDNLIGFKASLRIHYQILTAVTIPEALNHLEKHPDIKIIFCDQRMPEKTGVEFFEDIRNTYPLPVRILLTAYTDVNSIIDAINKGNIFRYVSKPWNEVELISAIDEANKFYLANSMLAIKNDELQRAYDELNKFAYSVSHDIRGPLSGMLGAINIAHDIDDVAEIKNMLFLMEKSLKKLDAYILSMHDYYSLQRGELSISDIDFNDIAEEMKAIFALQSKNNDIVFNVSVTQDQTFRSDPVPLKLIFNNLISNAFKYQDKKSQNKSVEVIVEVKKNLATLYIKDTGIGILGNHIGNIFNLFYRASSQEAGTGFGLYNVKSALLKLNGQIEVNSTMYQGTTFKVSIPSI